MNRYFKTMLSLTAIFGLSIASSANADSRGYNYKAWNPGYHASSRSTGNMRSYRSTAPSVVHSESTPTDVAQAPTERRSYSYEPAQSANSSSGCGSAYSEQAPATTQGSSGTNRSFSYEPSMDSSSGGSLRSGRSTQGWNFLNKSKDERNNYRGR